MTSVNITTTKNTVTVNEGDTTVVTVATQGSQGPGFTLELDHSDKVNDSITVTPGIFGGADRTGTSGSDITGAIVETTFKF